MADAGKLFVVLGLKGKKFQKELKTSHSRAANVTRQIQRRFNSINLKKAAVSVAAFGAAVTYTSLKLVKYASAAEEIDSKFRVVFRGLEDEASNWAVKFASDVGRARQDVKKWMAGLQDTFVPLGFTRDRAFELSGALTQLAVDLGSFNDQADAEVIRNLTSALVGNHETVRQYGVIITEAALKTEALASGFKKSYTLLTEQEKVQLRYNMILKGTTDAQGDAMRTAAEYAGQSKQLRGNMTNLATTAGNELLPVFTDIKTEMNEWIKANETLINLKIGEFGVKLRGALDLVWARRDVFITLAEGAKQFGENIVTIGSDIKFMVDQYKRIPTIKEMGAGVEKSRHVPGWYKNIPTVKEMGGFIYNQYQKIPTINEMRYGLASTESPERHKLGLDRGKRIYQKPPWEKSFFMQYKESIRRADAIPGVKPPVKPQITRTGQAYTGGLGLAGAGGDKLMGDAQAMLHGSGYSPMQGAGIQQSIFSAKGQQMIMETREKMAEFANTTRKTVATINTGWLMVGDTMSCTLSSALTQSGNTFANIASSFRRMLTGMAADLAARAAVFSVLNLINPGFGAFHGGLSGFLGFNKVSKYAGGGYVAKPTLAMIGERGPERVLNPRETREYDRGGTTNIDKSEIIINATDSGRNGMLMMNDYELAEKFKRMKRNGLLEL